MDDASSSRSRTPRPHPAVVDAEPPWSMQSLHGPYRFECSVQSGTFCALPRLSLCCPLNIIESTLEFKVIKSLCLYRRVSWTLAEYRTWTDFQKIVGVTFPGQTQISQSTWKTYDKSKGHYFSFWAMRSVTSEWKQALPLQFIPFLPFTTSENRIMIL